MLKKLRKTLSEEFKKRYEKMEGHFLGLENRIYTTIEERLASLEGKFEELSDLLKDEIHARKEKNEEKMEAITLDDDADERTVFSEKVDDAKEAIVDKIKETKETVTENAKKVSKKVKKAKKVVENKIKKASKKEGKKVKKAKKVVAPKTEKKTTKVVEKVENDLTQIKGLGQKMAEKLAAEGIVSFAQLAKFSKKELKDLDEKIKSFAARYERYDWRKQAKDLK